jgi:hypothetical protein
LLENMQIASVRAAAKEQKINKIAVHLSKVVPDLTKQYTTAKLETEVLRVRARLLHAFQISFTLKAIEYILRCKANPKSFFIVDVGDSSGTHLQYLKAILMQNKSYSSYKFRYLSVNIDPVAIEKIRSQGLDAVLCRAEELCEKYNLKADLFLSFEMLEHLHDPISFMDTISRHSISEYFVITVPYVAQSRVGLHHIRNQQHRDVYAENTHIFELTPSDWKLIFLHSGWEVIEEKIYRQYPLKSIWIFTKPIWKKYDFEGFYGVILKRNRKWADCYSNFQECGTSA